MDPKGCDLVQCDLNHTAGVGTLRLTSQHRIARLIFESEFRLPDNADTIECRLVVRNAAERLQSVMTALTYLKALRFTFVVLFFSVLAAAGGMANSRIQTRMAW